MKTKIKIFLGFGLMAVLASCSGDKKVELHELPAVSVSTMTIESGATNGMVSASGRLEAQNSADISTRMMGYVTDLNVRVGERVKKGQLLASVNSADLDAKKAQADAGIAQATAAFNSAKKDYDRFSTLFAQQSATQKEMDDMTTHFEMAKSGLEAAKQMKNEVLAQYSYTHIRAPFDGVITGSYIKSGAMANPGMPLLSIEGEGKLEANVMVSENQIIALKEGMEADVVVKSLNKQLKGKIIELSHSARNTGGQYVVKIALDKEDSDLKPGMFINAVFPVEAVAGAEATQINIPKEALVKQGQLTGVYVISDANQALLRWVKVGSDLGEQVEVLSGISAGEEVVVKAEGRLFNGIAVSR